MEDTGYDGLGVALLHLFLLLRSTTYSLGMYCIPPSLAARLFGADPFLASLATRARRKQKQQPLLPRPTGPEARPSHVVRLPAAAWTPRYVNARHEKVPDSRGLPEVKKEMVVVHNVVVCWKVKST